MSGEPGGHVGQAGNAEIARNLCPNRTLPASSFRPLSTRLETSGNVPRPAFFGCFRRSRLLSAIPRVGVLRALENLRNRPGFDDLAVLEDGDVVAEHTDHGQIVADEHQRQPEPSPQFPDQQQNVGLGRHIEPGHDLVGDNEVRLERQRPGDAGALPLAA